MSEYDRLKQQKDAIVAREKAGQDRLREALQELLEASGEAHIEIDSVKAVRKMGRFLAAAEDAKKALAASAEQPVASQESEIWVRAKKLSVREHQTLVHISGGYTSDHNIWMNHEDVRSAVVASHLTDCTVPQEADIKLLRDSIEGVRQIAQERGIDNHQIVLRLADTVERVLNALAAPAKEQR